VNKQNQTCGMLDDGVCEIIKPGGAMAKRVTWTAFWKYMGMVFIPLICASYIYTTIVWGQQLNFASKDRVVMLEEKQEKLATKGDLMLLRGDFKSFRTQLIDELKRSRVFAATSRPKNRGHDGE